MAVYRLSVDYTLADQVVGPSGKVAFVPSIKLADATGTAFGTVGNPIFISGGSGGGAVTIADGADVAEGATSATSYSDATGAAAGTLVALGKGNYVLTAAMSAKLPASLGIKTAAASLSVAPASDASFVTSGPLANLSTSAANPFPMAGRMLTTPPVLTNGQLSEVGMSVDAGVRISGTLRATAGDSFGNANTVGLSSSDGTSCALRIFPYVFNGTSWDRQKKPNATNRLLSSAATTNATSAKASAGDLFKITGNNTTATKHYLKLYNKASAPTVGTDTPVLTFPLPGSAAFDISISPGYYFSTGIAFAITGAAADADTTAILAGDIECLNLLYA